MSSIASGTDSNTPWTTRVKEDERDEMITVSGMNKNRMNNISYY